MASLAPTAVATIDKEMSITHQDFLRILPGALGTGNYRLYGNRVVYGDEAHWMEITLSAGTERRIGALALPLTHVRLKFFGYAEPDLQAAITRFDRAFQRGGG
jgi:hypothetical protein